MNHRKRRIYRVSVMDSNCFDKNPRGDKYAYLYLNQFRPLLDTYWILSVPFPGVPDDSKLRIRSLYLEGQSINAEVDINGPFDRMDINLFELLESTTRTPDPFLQLPDDRSPYDSSAEAPF